MNAALKLVATDKLTVAAHRPKRTPTNRQQEITANLSLISRTWRTLTQAQRDSFTALGQVWSPVHGKSTASGLTVFQSLNGVRLNSGQAQILTDAPVQADFIGKLHPFTLTAMNGPTTALTLSDAPRTQASFTLTVSCPTFNGPVLALATRPLSAGVTSPDPRAFRPERAGWRLDFCAVRSQYPGWAWPGNAACIRVDLDRSECAGCWVRRYDAACVHHAGSCQRELV